MKIIPLNDHSANLDPSAKLEWSNNKGQSVYSVRGGFVAVPEYGLAMEGLFETLKIARDHLAA